MKSKNFEYKYIVNGRTVIALSHYAGRTVRGVAKCSPEDEFDVEFGKKLAAARCDLKIAEKRCSRAAERCTNAMDVRQMAEANYKDCLAFYLNAFEKVQVAEANLDKLMAADMVAMSEGM